MAAAGVGDNGAGGLQLLTRLEAETDSRNGPPNMINRD
jgi:hypothetical protein